MKGGHEGMSRNDKKRSLFKRIKQGGVLAAGVALLFTAGCDSADASSASHASPELTDGTELAEPTLRGGEGDLVALCLINSDGTFEDLLVAESEVAFYLSQGALLGMCSDFFCGGS